MNTQRSPLREFVYLDEVSLRSLLASQTGALTDQITDLLSRADEAEIAGTISASSPVLKAEVRSRYQTSNSQGTQTSRKSIVQSLFKEFHELSGIGLVLEPIGDSEPAIALDDLLRGNHAARVSELTRGALVEVEVELVADPIFRFSTIISEIADMSREYPDMLSFPGAADVMAQAEPINRVLQRLLAGLIPLRARATNVVVVEHQGTRCLVPRSTASALGVRGTSLYVVGVTEHLSYWRDVRRVLFSGARFTVMCRVARDGLSHDWVPVKLSDVLAEVAPAFPSALDAVGKAAFGPPRDSGVNEGRELQRALEIFIASVETKAKAAIPAATVARAKERARSYVATSMAAQNEAFRAVTAVLDGGGFVEFSPEEWMDLRRQARAEAGLTLFQSSPAPLFVPQPETQTSPAGAREELLLDTEVIAIYW